MPVAMLHAYARMLPRLEAEEQLRRIEAASMPWMKSEDQRSVLRSLQQSSGRRDGERRFKEPREVALALGIPVVTKPR